MKILKIISVVAFSVLISAGIVQAATRNVTSTLGGASGDIFQVDGGFKVSSLHVGAQGVGGVTYFNGTIINNTTTSGADNPVTFGDNVRIDGRIYRGSVAGTSDTLPVLINDNVEIAGSLTVASIASAGVVTSANIADSAIATADVADSAITSAKIADGTITGTDIASTTDLNIDTLTATGNLTQSATTEGLAKGWAYVSSDGSILASYNVTSVTRTTTGHYDVVFNFNVTDGADYATRPYMAVPSGTGGAIAKRLIGVGPADNGTSNTLIVWTMDNTLAFADGVFMVMVF